MRRLQILIDEDLDVALDRLSAGTGQSKAALIRQFVREHVRALPPLASDPIARMVGSDDFPPTPIDDVVYG